MSRYCISMTPDGLSHPQLALVNFAIIAVLYFFFRLAYASDGEQAQI